MLAQEELGAAGLTKRPTSCMLILPKPLKGAAPADDEAKEFAESYAEVRGAGGSPAPSSCAGRTCTARKWWVGYRR